MHAEDYFVLCNSMQRYRIFLTRDAILYILCAVNIRESSQ